MQVRGRILSNYALQAHRVTSTREEGFLFMKSSICSNFSLSRHDVDLPHRDVKLTPLCHVATCIFTSRRQFVQASVTSRRVFSRRDVNLHKPLSRSEVIPHVATSFLHVSVTSRRGIPTSRRELNPLSIMSRRCLQRRDVA